MGCSLHRHFQVLGVVMPHTAGKLLDTAHLADAQTTTRQSRNGLWAMLQIDSQDKDDRCFHSYYFVRNSECTNQKKQNI